MALPLLAVSNLRASAFEVAALIATGFAPFLVFGLYAGVVADRRARRPLLVVADVGRAAALVTVPVAHALGVLTMAQLFVVAFVTGTLATFFDVAYQSYLPSLVPRQALLAANTKLEATRSASFVAGPAVAAWLFHLLSLPAAVLADVGSYLVSVLCLALIRTRESGLPRPFAHEPLREVREGVRYVVTHPHLRALAACAGMYNFFNRVVSSIFFVYAVRRLGLSSGEVASVFAIANVGAVLGAALAPSVAATLGLGRSILLSAALGVAFLGIPLAPRAHPIPFLVAAQFLTGFGILAYNVLTVSLRQAITPPELLGRMNAVMRVVVWGTVPLGAVAGGAMASAFGLRPALFVGSIGAPFAALPVLLSPLARLRRLDQVATLPVDALSVVPGEEREP
jgi:MFS family permease